MFLCTRLRCTLPTQLHQQIGRIKSEFWPHFAVRYQYQLFSNLVFQRPSAANFCSCVTSTILNDNTIRFQTRREHTFANPTSRLDYVRVPLLHHDYLIKYYSSNVPDSSNDPKPNEEKLSLFKRFKKMYKEYGYVLIPVHVVTSAIWFSSFYYLTKSGVDVASVLESIGVGETLVEKLRNTNSTMGYLTISFALYKIATPLRYTVTLGGTTLSIKYLRDWGYIKPIPPKDKLKEIMHDKKDKFMQKKENLKKRLRGKRFIKKTSLRMGLKKS